MKIALFSVENPNHPCPKIRILEPIGALNGRIEIFNGLQMLQEKIPFGAIDLLLFQRRFPGSIYKDVCDAALRTSKPIVYETDDLLQRVPSPAPDGHIDKALAKHLDRFAEAADAVTVSTDYLAEHFRKFAKQVFVLPNYLSARLWTEALRAPPQPAAGERIRIGLVGSRHHEKDFERIAPAVKTALKRHANVEAVFYGVLPKSMEATERVHFVPGDYRYEHHPRNLAALKLDIALAPLTGSALNRARSPIKFLEFGFLGIAGIYADLEPFRGTVVPGENGLLCADSVLQWEEALLHLIEHPERRQQLGHAARQCVSQEWMLPAHAHKWHDTYAAVIAAGPRR